MESRVLIVGQCSMDFSNISRMLQTHFSAQTSAATTLTEAITLAKQTNYNLILVNRLLDIDGSAGVEVVRAVIADPEISATPVMLVSNFPEAQQEAVEVGAVPGFGKAQLRAPETLESLRAFLQT